MLQKQSHLQHFKKGHVMKLGISPADRGKWTPEDIRRAMLLYAITDEAWLGNRTLPWCVLQTLAGGATCMQLRMKGASEDKLVEYARALRPLCEAAGVPLIVNDNVEAAVRAKADGAHIGQDDGSVDAARMQLGYDRILGVSAQTVEQALRAQESGADYLGVGALIPTSTKPDAADVSLDELHAICEAVEIPVVGIGGLNVRTIPQLAGCGADGAAVVSAIFAAKDCDIATRELRVVCEQTFMQ